MMGNVKQRVILKFKDDAFVEQLLSLLLKAGKVKVGGLGIFEIRNIEPRTGYNVGTGKKIEIPAHKKLAFRPTARIKNLVQSHEG